MGEIGNKDFDKIYLIYYPKLVRFSTEYLLSKEDAENVVQDVFLHVLEEYKEWSSIENLNAFLFRLVKNKSIDFLRRKIAIERNHARLKEYQLKYEAMEEFDDSLSENDISNIIIKAIEALPPKCKEIFVLNKIEGFKYNEIAEKLAVSPHTVRNQMSIALKKMKTILEDYPLLLFFLFC